MAANFLPYVFESFRQADATITRNYSGLGLGLAIVRQLVELHGGTVCTSPGLDMGSTFTSRLPSMQVNSMVGSEAQVLAGAGNLLGVKVLLVDDEVDSREFMRFVLADSGPLSGLQRLLLRPLNLPSSLGRMFWSAISGCRRKMAIRYYEGCAL